MNNVKEWYIKHAKKVDKKYYSKGESIYVLHRRTLLAAASIIDLISDVSADDLFLELYMLVKDTNFGSFVGKISVCSGNGKRKAGCLCRTTLRILSENGFDYQKE